MKFTTNDYSNQKINGIWCIWLQYYGWAEAKPAVEFKVGERIRWNTGSSSEVLEILSETAKTITLKVGSSDERYDKGQTYERRFKKDRLVAIG